MILPNPLDFLFRYGGIVQTFPVLEKWSYDTCNGLLIPSSSIGIPISSSPLPFLLSDLQSSTLFFYLILYHYHTPRISSLQCHLYHSMYYSHLLRYI